MSTAGIANDHGFTYGFATGALENEGAARVSCSVSRPEAFSSKCNVSETVCMLSYCPNKEVGKKNIQTAKNKNLFIMS